MRGPIRVRVYALSSRHPPATAYPGGSDASLRLSTAFALPMPHVHNWAMTGFGAEDWRRIFQRLSEELSPTGERHITLIGGVAMALGYGSRRTSKDADTIMQPDVAAEVLPAARRIAPEFGLDSDWLNQKAVEANKIVIPEPPGRVVFETDRIALEVPSAEHMLAMKLARFATNTDQADAKILLKIMRLRFSDAEDVWTHIGGLMPVAMREGAHYNLLTLWDDLNESA
jgi:hypothetical protein